MYFTSARARKLRVGFEAFDLPTGDAGSVLTLREILGEGGTSAVSPGRWAVRIPRLGFVSRARRKLVKPESHHVGFGADGGSRESQNSERGSVVIIMGSESDG